MNRPSDTPDNSIHQGRRVSDRLRLIVGEATKALTAGWRRKGVPLDQQHIAVVIVRRPDVHCGSGASLHPHRAGPLVREHDRGRDDEAEEEQAHPDPLRFYAHIYLRRRVNGAIVRADGRHDAATGNGARRCLH